MMIFKIWRALLFILLLSIIGNTGCAQNEKVQDKRLTQEIDNLLKRDSINELIILELKKQINQPIDTSGKTIRVNPEKINPVEGTQNLPIQLIDRGEGKQESLLYFLVIA
jgi:hypothetical protein